MSKSPARDFRTPLFPYEPRHTPVRVAGGEYELSWVEAGYPGGRPLVLLHGNPTWSFLYRGVIPYLTRHRVIAVDLLGFGRSDKLPRFEDYTLENHLSALGQLMDALALSDVTLVVHDWAGPIGLGWAVENRDRVSRLVIMNTWAFAPKPHNRVPQPLKTFRRAGVGEGLVLGANAFVNVALPLGVRHFWRMRGEVMRAYRAPLPDWRSRWPVLAFPRNIPVHPDDPAFARMKRTDEALSTLRAPALLIWGQHDPVFPPRVMRKFEERLDVRGKLVLPRASHFLQEDEPEAIGRAIAEHASA